MDVGLNGRRRKKDEALENERPHRIEEKKKNFDLNLFQKKKQAAAPAPLPRAARPLRLRPPRDLPRLLRRLSSSAREASEGDWARCWRKGWHW